LAERGLRFLGVAYVGAIDRGDPVQIAALVL
jgi:hypothetical protein